MSRTVVDAVDLERRVKDRFLSRSAQHATRDYGVHSVSLLAIRN
jgi:hypothetical protein